MKDTQYSIVIATRNRPEALALSVPLMLSQSRLPKALIVVDSSDDPSRNIALIEGLVPTTQVKLQHHRSPMGASLQRNRGLAEVDTEVVFFPDDDSMVLPGALEAMMRVYDLDWEGQVGGVCSAEARQAPEGLLSAGANTAYRMTKADRIKARIGRTRFAIEDRLFRDPFFLVAERKYAAQGVPPNSRTPDWLTSENAILVPWMTGFRMSFRTHLIREIGFNEALGKYSLAEDIDACFGILNSHLLVGARNAHIYHHKVPTRRANGRALGAMHILNRAYVLARAEQTDPQLHAMQSRFVLYKIAQYAVGAGSSFGQGRLAGAWQAYRVMGQLFTASPEDLTPLYLKLRAHCFEDES